MATTIAAAEWYGRLNDAISAALLGAMQPMQAGAATAYAGTRWGPEFTIEPADPVREASLVNPVPDLHLVEYETAPHEIHAHTGKGLHFYWVREDRWFRGPSVNHPGTKGRQAIDLLFAEANRHFGELLTAGLEALNRD